MSISLNPNKVWKTSVRANPKNKKIDFSKRNDKLGLSQISKGITSFFVTPKPQPTRVKPSVSNPSKNFNPSPRHAEVSFKIFKPKTNLYQSETSSNSKDSSIFKRSLFGWIKPSENFLRSKFSSFVANEKTVSIPRKNWLKSISLSIQYWLAKFRIIPRFNWFALWATLFSLFTFVIYLCAFDTFFLVKDYKVTFSENSYINSEDMQLILTNVRNQRFAWVIPNNQFWFLNDRTITIAAKNYEPEIQNIRITRRVWPNSAEIRITTNPILLTLGINGEEYWRVAQDGRVLSLDDAGLRDNLVVVERRVTFNKPNATLKDYSFGDDCPNFSKRTPGDCVQLNRFWFVIWLWSLLDQLGIEHNKTVFPSLYDTDVYIFTDTGTKLMFNSSVMSQEVQENRIKSTINTEIFDKSNTQSILYIDFRIPKRIFVCRAGQGCA